MSESSSSQPDHARLRRLIAAYEQRRSAGRPVDEADILRSYPDLAEGFLRYVQRRSRTKSGELGNGRDEPIADLPAARSDPADWPAERSTAEYLPAGTLVDRYRVLEVLGTGSMGVVYRALDQRLEREIALKMPDLQGQNRAVFLERFETEARLAAGLSHPSLCPILDFGTCDVGENRQQPYLTMPVLPGPSLAQFVELEGAQTPADVIQLVRRIVEGLQEMHEHGITHRDLKPSNVLLDRRGRPVITDFGLARSDRLSSDVRMTQTAALMGSPAYCSPEQVRGEQTIDARTDLYSLGVLMYELLTGHLPFEGSVGEVLGAVLHLQPPPPTRLRPSLSPAMEALCVELLEKDPAARPASAEELLKRLEDPALVVAPPATNRWLQRVREFYQGCIRRSYAPSRR
ncbi:serine/threonine-protein kinase [Roseimaritima sediminicola]|uniref:serine/threonine-protein kinase n=1 Tax=Roseimaritima sediminicola TaxID=2662066 RepID=UPI0012985622|nr:serine/threonine-protein kinase [Roseimaritima sediminicola]